MPKQTVLVAGAGIAGVALAYWLERYGFEPTLIEHAPAFRTGGYMIDVWGVGYDILERYGVLETARDRGYLFDALKFVDAQGRPLSALRGEVMRKALRDRFFSIPRGDLARTLYDRIAGRVEVIFGTAVQAFRQDAAGLEIDLAGGDTRRFELLVGTDGLHSRVRTLLFGEGGEKYLGYVAASFIVPGYPHRDEAAYVSFARPGRQISRYAMRQDRTAFLLVFAADERPAIAPHDLAGQKSLLHAVFSRDGWETPEILRRLEAADELYFDPVSQIRIPSWSQGRVALAGDAAHAPSLLAGAGAGFAMLGAYILAGELRAAGGDYARAYQAYQERLQPFMLDQQKQAVAFAGSFTPKTALGLAVRNGIINLMNLPGPGVWLVRRTFGQQFRIPDYQ